MSRELRRVVVTGGAGFLGSHLCERLVGEGVEVVCLDNLLTGDPANLLPLQENPAFRFVRCDVTDFIHVPGEVDAVLHVPLRELMSPGVFREERWGEGELSRPVYFFELVGDTVWGATAALLRQLLALITGTDPGGPTDLDPARGTEMVHYELGPDGLGGVV